MSAAAEMSTSTHVPKVNGFKEEVVEVSEHDESRRIQQEEGDDDPVVHEIPVFLAKTLAEHLYLFQYPVRPAHMSYDTSTVVSSKIRPQQQQVELAVALDTHNPNYDSSKGEQIALNVDGCGSKNKKHLEGGDDLDGRLYSSGIMDKQVLSSTRALKQEATGRYAVGILGGNELHVTPIKGIINLRPDLKYLDKGDKTARAEGRAEEDPDDPSSAGGGAGEEDDIKQVTVRFAKTDQDAAKKYRERSYEFQQKKAEEEPWVPTRFHNVKSAKWEEESQNLFCKKMDEEIQSLVLTPEEYLSTLTTS